MELVTQDTDTVNQLVTLENAVQPCVIKEAANETHATDVTIDNEHIKMELIQYMVDMGSMSEGAEVTTNTDGIMRFADPEDKKHGKAGWCIPFYNDDEVLIKAMFGTHRNEDDKQFWESGTFSQLDGAEKNVISKKLADKRALVAKESNERQVIARKQLKAKLTGLSIATSHPYLEKKGIKSHGALIANNGELIIPLFDIHGELQTAQRIKPDGSKFLWAGCGKKAAFHKIPGDSRVILISEGYATAASLSEATGYTSIMAIDAGNLLAVTNEMKKVYPNSAIVMCADNDQYKDINTGVEKAKSILESTAVPYVFPEFKDTASKPTDFNDLALLEGLDEVIKQIEPIVEKAKLRIPQGFSLKPSGVFKHYTGKDGNRHEEWISSLLKITALTRDEVSENWGRLLELVDKDGVEHKFAMPMNMLTGQPTDYLKPLVDKGLTYNHEQRNLLHCYMSQANPINRARCVSKVGWFENIYVLPNEVIGENDETYIYQSPTFNSKGFESKGTLEQWRNEVASLCIGNSRLLFGVSVAFATVLLDMLDGESGGFHFRCGSSRGKTTILLLAKSVWGSPDNLPRWRTTANGLEGLAAMHNHSLLCLDEFSQLAEVSPKVAGEAIYMLGNGEGKQRSKKDGSMAKRQTWQLLYLSAGEVSLKATLEQAGVPVRAGQEVRFIDLPADAGVNLGVFDTVQNFPDGNRFALAIKENAHAYYGTASKAFIKEITTDYSNVQDSLINKVEAFTDGLSLDGADPQVLRVARRFAIVAAAGEIASELNITCWDAGQSNWAASNCFNEWLESRGGSESHEETQAIETVRGRILENSAARFIHDSGQPQNGAIWGCEGTEGYFIYTKAFNEHLCAGLDPKFVANLLNEMGVLSGSSERLTKTKRINSRNARCYHILPAFFIEPDLTEADSTKNDDMVNNSKNHDFIV